jgi:hypothetical protein
MLKTYDVTCPDPDCAEDFQVEMEPPVEGVEGELITCPMCDEPWEWEYDATTGTLTLMLDEEEDDDMLLGDLDDEEEDEEEDEDEEPA